VAQSDGVAQETNAQCSGTTGNFRGIEWVRNADGSDR
jgi:hypothetical protein